MCSSDLVVTKVGTAIISTRTAVYYVDPSYQGASTGFQAKPFKNINDAVAQMQSKGLKKGYIYLTKTVEVKSPITIPAGLNLQIESSPYDENYTTSTSPTSGYNRLNSNPESTAVRTIKKAANFVGDSLFKITDSKSTLNLYNVKVDGNGTAITGTAPLINVSGGKLKIKKGVTIENALVSGNDVASAILISGSGQVIADPAGGDAFITGNTSKDNGSAVIIASGASNAHPLVTASNINITGNTAYYGNDMTVAANKRKANVNLNNSLIWVETDKTLTGIIGVSVASSRLPQNDSQATPIADFADRTSGGIQPYTKSNFESDVNGQRTEEADVSNYETGTTTNQITGRIYLTAPFKGLTVSYVDKDGNTIGVNTVPNTDPAYDPNKFQLGAKNPVTKQKAVGSIAGETVDGGIIPAPSLGGYVISEVTVSPNYAKTGESILHLHA